MTKTSVALLVLVVGLFVTFPSSAFAQSGIAGVVRDTTGAVLPGVTVEASSAALIEKVRSATTDAGGQYRIVDLRPGAYSITFALTGFNVVKREGIDLPANFTAQINAELRVGALEETVTVSGETPVVDLQSTQRREVLTSAMLDNLPQGRSFQAIGAMLPAISMAKFDVGGSTGMQMSNLTAYGSLENDQTMAVDGISNNSGFGGGGNVGIYHNDGAYQEMVYQVSGGTAEERTAGVHINMIPKEGGNAFKGDLIALFANTGLQSDNFSDDLRRRGLTTPAALHRLWDVNVNFGGRIIRDKLWFFSSVRNYAYNAYVANVFDRQGNQAIDNNRIQGFTNRLTTQLTPKNKLTAMYDRLPKWRERNGIEVGGINPEATTRAYFPVYHQAQAKWTSPMTSKILLEAGFGTIAAHQTLSYQPEVRDATCFVAFALCPAGTDYGDIAKQDILLNTRSNAALVDTFNPWWRQHFVGSMSYVTGTHNLKIGAHHSRGGLIRILRRNGDIVQRYSNGAPHSVLAFNTPTGKYKEGGTYTRDLGLYIQDSWTIRRLTLNPGLRWDWLNAKVREATIGAGRFVPARHFDEIENLPNWSNTTPRFGAAYDMFGDGRTAIKGSVGLYILNEFTTFPDTYNPMVDSSDQRTWTDTNKDDIAQENELGPTTNTTFGIRRNRNADPNIKRPGQLFYMVGVQRQLMSGVALSVTYNRREYNDLTWTDNLATTSNDYTLVTIPDPRGSGTLPVYNLNRDKLGLVDELDTHSSSNTRSYKGLDVNLNGRLPNGGSFTAGTSTGRTTLATCEVDDPNLLRFCDQSQHSVPFQTQFKLLGRYPLPWDIRFSGVFQSVPGAEIPVAYLVGRTQVPTLTLTQVSVRLNEPGSEYMARVNQLDIGIAKTFRSGRYSFSPQLDLFNVLNTNPVVAQVNTFGPAFGTPQQVLNARLVRLGLQMQF